MIDKEYLKQLKEDDYIAWDDLTNDTMVTGGNDATFDFLPIIMVVCIAFFFFWLFML